MAKRLIVCLDGTWNSPDKDGKATNVVKIMRAVAPVDDQGTEQITFYDAGVGADSSGLERLYDGVTGRGLEQNVRDGYRFLASNWLPGDEIYLFGFSRGAFTARSLCGLIGVVGLLPRRDLDRLSEAWKLYRTPEGQRDPAACRALRSLRPGDVRIKCLGVWDTVGARGVPGQLLQWMNKRHEFHDVRLPSFVDCAFQGLAIDEKRRPFGPVLWEKPESMAHEPTIEQVWLPGVHANVGGGYEDSGLSDMALSWMISRVQAHSHLAFDEDYIRDHVAPDALGNIPESRGAIYWGSWLSPLERLIGQAPAEVSWLGRVLPRTSRPEKDDRSAGEMIHWSAISRYDREIVEDGEPRRYRPANLEAALERGLQIARDRVLDTTSLPAPQPAMS
jgi:uncharacterized protein (DUF2235 family)